MGRQRLRRGAAHVGRAIVGVLALLALECVAPALGARVAVAAPRPNIVVIMTDDQTIESMRVMSNVNRLLAAKGTTFDTSLVSFPLCCPSRATFLTGQYSHNTGVVGNNLQNGLANLDETNTLPVWLQRAGYSTILVGKYLNGYSALEPRTIPPGWTEWYAALQLTYYDYRLNENGKVVKYGRSPADYLTDVLTNRAVDVIHRRAGHGKPFFLWLTYFAPHYGGPREPGDPPGVKTAVPAPRDKGVFADEPLPMPPSFDEADVSDKPAAIQNRPLLSPTDVDGITAAYRQRLESLLAVDDGVGRIVAALRARHALGNTLIVFTSDNGWLQGEHRIGDQKLYLYEPAVRVPLVMRGPGVPHDTHLGQPVANVDLAPTIADVAHATPGLVTDGRSLLPLFSDTGLEWGRDILLERGPGGGPQGTRLYTALRTESMVYAEYSTGEHELYDLSRDPDELQSLQADPAYTSIQAKLAARLALLRNCAGPGCELAPALELDPAYEGDCVRTVSVGGGDAGSVDAVDFLEDGRPVGHVDDAPFQQTFAGAPGSKVRALVLLDDGRRLTLDLAVRVCA
jgi:arylsulfatase A-like enzyme